MRAVRTLLMLMASTCCAASAWAEAPMTRASVLRAGKGSWTVDAGGPLGPVEVSMQRKTSGWEVKVHGMYPIMDALGRVHGIASTLFVWLTNVEDGRETSIDSSLQRLPGRWEPGQTFDVTFSIPLKAFEGNPQVGLHVALGDDSGSVPSANLEPRP